MTSTRVRMEAGCNVARANARKRRVRSLDGNAFPPASCSRVLTVASLPWFGPDGVQQLLR